MKQLKFIKQTSASLIIALALSFGFSACSKDKGNIPEPEVEMRTVVYVAGWESNGNSDVAKYWKDGVAMNITDGTNHASANAIAISGTDVYTAGYETDKSTYNYVAKYWKNRTEVAKLTDGENDAEATGIAISGNDVHVVGYEEGSNRTYVGKYWKNGILEKVLTNDGDDFYSIAVVGDDVYIAGEDDGAAKYWKNGIAQELEDGDTYYASEIAVVGKDVYVLSSSQDGMYWKNGKKVFVTIPGATRLSTSGIAVVGDDVYVSGYDWSSDINNNVAVYWKNGTVHKLTDPAISNGSTVGIAADGDDVYIAGEVSSILQYWKNNKENVTILSDGPTHKTIYAIALGKEPILQ